MARTKRIDRIDKPRKIGRARRPIFIPQEASPYVKEVEIEFDWFPGFSTSQVRKRIMALHDAARQQGIKPILEISSKSENPLGVKLSAFNLHIREGNRSFSIECAYQGSKVFERGGPYVDLYQVSSRDAKTDPRLKSSGKLMGFNYLGVNFPLMPVTAFYDWLYIRALYQNIELSTQLLDYKAFSDIAFNPKKSVSCQARSAALFVALYTNKLIEDAVEDKDFFINLGYPTAISGVSIHQMTIPFIAENS